MEASRKPVKVLVTGGTGLVGSNIREVVEYFKSEPLERTLEEVTHDLEEKQDNDSLGDFLRVNVADHEYIFLSSKDCNLINLEDVRKLFEKH